MKLFDYVEENNSSNISIYCDLDGVLAEYDIGNFDYETIRPINTTINNIQKLYSKNNVNIYILSICKNNKVVDDKIIWLKKYMPFLNNENIVLISKEKEKGIESDELKSNYLIENAKSDINIVIDDDIRIIKKLKENNNLKIFHVSSLID
ncbi:MAG: hypothetical protein J6O62_02295 [Bacilli bacterium]|nr:hypothetical protein [Bacilli bacterium]MBO6194896.1 hypothetical protein [Bacilli bacterium]